MMPQKDCLRSAVKSIKVLYYPLRFLYHGVYEGFVSGYFSYMMKFFFVYRRQEMKSLHQYGFDNISLYKTRSWRRGQETDHAHRRYYIAEKDGQKCFIKVAQCDTTVDNEIAIAESLRGIKLSFVPQVITYDRFFLNDRALFVTEFIDGLHPFFRDDDFHTGYDLTMLRQYCRSFLYIHQELCNISLVHGDIHNGNLLIDPGGHLWLLDFGISRINGRMNGVDYRHRPGTYFLESDTERIYDDVYSFKRILDQYASETGITNTDDYKQVVARIGLLSFCVPASYLK